jgi:hypothetical protein
MSREKNGSVENVMKMEIPVLAVLLLVANELMARVAVQGIEQALVATALEWSVKKLESARAILRKH